MDTYLDDRPRRRKNPVEKIGEFHHDLHMRRLICVVAVSVPVA
jgi:hypothetical protein